MEDASNIDHSELSTKETLHPEVEQPSSAESTDDSVTVETNAEPETCAVENQNMHIEEEPELQIHDQSENEQDAEALLEEENGISNDIPESVNDQPQEQDDDHDHAEMTGSEQELPDCSEFDSSLVETENQDEEPLSPQDSTSLERRHSVRTEALIQAAARAVLSLTQNQEDQEPENHDDQDESILSSTTDDNEQTDETRQLDHDDTLPSRPESACSLPSPTEQSSIGDAADSISHRGTEDDIFSDRSPRSSIHSVDGPCDDDVLEQMTEKGDQSPYVRSRVVSGVSVSGESVISDLSRLSRYEKEDFIPTSRSNRPAFRSPSSVRAIQMASPTPSIYSPPTQSVKRQSGIPTISRLGSFSSSAQDSPGGRTTPRFKRQEAPLVLLHATLLPLRWSYGEVMNHFETKKVAPPVFSSESLKNLRGAWRQVQDRLGDTVLERGILLPHPQNDFEILEERLLEALELPLRRRARILECGHYVGPSNDTAVSDDEDDYDDFSDDEEFEARTKPEKRHWCKTCKGDIRCEELGAERVFRLKVYASNGLMSPGAWEACWKEMERVDIEVEPIIDSVIQRELSQLVAAFEQEQQQQLEAEQHQQTEEEQRVQLEEERRLVLEQERQELEAQRQQFEEQRLELDMHRKLVEEEQRQHVEEARRQELEEEQRQIEEQRQQLELARQQFEEERRQRLEDEQKQIPASRSSSRNSYVEDDIASPTTGVAVSPGFDDRRRDSERLREIYGDTPRASSEGLIGNPSPAIHIHVDSGRQREEDQSSRQLATIPARRDGSLQTAPVPYEVSQQAYTHPPTAPSSEQTYPRHEDRRKTLETASLPELLGETIRVLLQDPKNVAIAVLVVLIAVLAGQFAKQDRGFEVYKPQQHYQVQHHQLDNREPVGQVIMNTPAALHQTASSWSTASQQVETIYKTVTAEAFSQKPAVSQNVETIYETVTRQAIQEAPTRVVETIYTTVNPENTAAPEVASELPSSSADPSVDLNPLPFDSPDAEDNTPASSATPLVDIGLDPFTPPTPSPEIETEPESHSDQETLKTTASNEVEVELVTQDIDAPTSASPPNREEDELNAISTPHDEIEDNDTPSSDIVKNDGKDDPILDSAHLEIDVEAPTLTPGSSFTETATTIISETITETILETITRTHAGVEPTVTPSEHEDVVSQGLSSDATSETHTRASEQERIRETFTETVRVTSTIEVDAPEKTSVGPASQVPPVDV